MNEFLFVYVFKPKRNPSDQNAVAGKSFHFNPYGVEYLIKSVDLLDLSRCKFDHQRNDQILSHYFIFLDFLLYVFIHASFHGGMLVNYVKIIFITGQNVVTVKLSQILESFDNYRRFFLPFNRNVFFGFLLKDIIMPYFGVCCLKQRFFLYSDVLLRQFDLARLELFLQYFVDIGLDQ